MRNIFINLLTNAIKFSPGQAIVSLRVSGDREKISLAITDQGVGINPAEVEQIFEPFNRGENVSSIQGTGLGLSIVRKAVTLLDGEIKLLSNLNQGTTFTIILNV
jgi:signal transduction histidine kinase